MKKKVMVPALVSVFAVTSFAGTASAAHEGQAFMADLTPDQEVMDVESEATGEAHIQVSEDGESLDYTVEAHDLDDTMAGHIHSGAVGEDGPVEVFLFENEEGMDYDGEVATGTLTEDDLVGDMTWEEFSGALVAEEAYVNLHTEEYPDGEIRGQVETVSEDEAAAMPDEMPQTGMGGASNDGWMTTFWASITALVGGAAALFIRKKNQA
ncbi:CHRD domain-containing protein [Sinobaca sp. H24]|uniref:CHRD domain-containing protein n=1 Tax=Sinobaca sp. H24 TaxID=2923376 RepID=UPI00207A3192|nr:CHRD domain-containing protein [Sinobaca sp. H24]